MTFQAIYQLQTSLQSIWYIVHLVHTLEAINLTQKWLEKMLCLYRDDWDALEFTELLQF